MTGNSKVTIKILVIVIVVLALALIYVLAIKPAVSGFVVDKQVSAYEMGYTQAQADLLNNIIVQLQQAGYAQIPVGENLICTQTVDLARWWC